MDLNRFLHPLNPFLIRLLHSPLHFVMSAGLMTITYTGRRSGRRITIPVGFQDHSRHVDILVSKAQGKKWWRNFESLGDVELRIRGKRVSGNAQLVPSDTAAFAEAFTGALDRLPLLARQFKIDDFDRSDGLSRAQIAVLAEHARVVRVDIAREG